MNPSRRELFLGLAGAALPPFLFKRPGPQDLPPIVFPPDDPLALDAWRQALIDWREETRKQLRYDGTAYARPEFAWAAKCYACAMIMTWDERFLDARRGRYRVEELLDEGEREFGGYDAVVLWQAYPRLGFDSRNQFDFYRGLPGGLSGLRDAVRRFHARGVRVFVDYNPWDVGTRREPATDAQSLASLVQQIEADGIFLDTLDEARAGLRGELDGKRPGVALETEGALDIDRLEVHHLSWAQWFEQGAAPGILRNRWFEPRHMMHLVRRWDTDHTDELHTAWMNGAGILIWENVFGSWNGWSGENRALLRTMLPIQRHFHRHFSEGNWVPFVSSGSEGVFAHERTFDGARLWTVVDRRKSPAGPSNFAPVLVRGERFFDLVAGQEIAHRGEVPSGGIAAFLAVSGSLPKDLPAFLAKARRRTLGSAADRQRHPHPVRPGSAAVRDLPAGMHAVPAGTYEVTSVFRHRECGELAYFPAENQVYPDLHRLVGEHRKLDLKAFAVADREVTNREFAEFLHATRYRPAVPDAFLRRWSAGAVPAGEEDEPVTYVDLDDARAYARWRGMRLPTDAEWQLAVVAGRLSHGKVWNWTESEYSDGATRFCLLKGGGKWQAEGSEWYADGGLQTPEFVAKFIGIWPGLDRSETIGFRLAVSLV